MLGLFVLCGCLGYLKHRRDTRRINNHQKNVERVTNYLEKEPDAEVRSAIMLKILGAGAPEIWKRDERDNSTDSAVSGRGKVRAESKGEDEPDGAAAESEAIEMEVRQEGEATQDKKLDESTAQIWSNLIKVALRNGLSNSVMRPKLESAMEECKSCQLTTASSSISNKSTPTTDKASGSRYILNNDV